MLRVLVHGVLVLLVGTAPEVLYAGDELPDAAQRARLHRLRVINLVRMVHQFDAMLENV
jgi:hypothetical protein